MLFDWLMQLDLRDATITIPGAENTPWLERRTHSTMIEDLRNMALLLASHAPNDTKAYLIAIANEDDHYKVKSIRPFSKTLASAAPNELAALIKRSLLGQPGRGRSRRDPLDGAFGFSDTDYLPVSPAQPPFLDLLDTIPQVGLELIRSLVVEAVEHQANGKKAGTNGFTIDFGGEKRFFPWVQTYFWSRSSQAQVYAASSGLMALEAWSQERLDKGEDFDTVLRDILGPEGSCAAFLLVALDVLLSHWPNTRDALVPFVANPDLLANDRKRLTLERLGDGMMFQREPKGRVMVADLAKRQSRTISLEKLIPYYINEDGPGQKVRSLLADATNVTGPHCDEADFSDPAFIGSHALNMLDKANWIEVEGGLAYKSPMAEAAHLERLEVRRQASERSNSVELRIQMAISNPAKGTQDLARDAVHYAAGDLPDFSDTDHLKSRSTRLISTALLVARDGGDALLNEHENWVRTVVDTALSEEVDRHGSNESLDFNRPAQGICALIHLWSRNGRVEDRNNFLKAILRKDQAAATAVTAAHKYVKDTDPRLLKSAVRLAFTCCRWRWNPHNEDSSIRAAYEEEKASKDADAVTAEIMWLDGGPEPSWPELPEEPPILPRKHSKIFSPNSKQTAPKRDGDIFRDSSKEAVVHVNSQELSKWIALLNNEGCALADWREEIVDSYSAWSARRNGHGKSADAEINRAPRDWNDQFYVLVSSVLMDAAQDRFLSLLQPIIELPDQSFCDIAATIVNGADVHYFNEANRPPDRAFYLRQKMVSRAIKLRHWDWDRRRGKLGIGLYTGPLIGMILLNHCSPISGAKTYLVPAIFGRVDPLLEALQPMMAGGPTAFIALCTMNTLNVAPTARHIDFLLDAVETWLDVTSDNRSMWHELAIGRKVAEWFTTAAVDDPSLFGQDHPSRNRIDSILGHLVSLGVSEAHDLEVRIQKETSGLTPR